MPNESRGCVKLRISATAAQVARWDRKVVESRGRGERRPSRSREIRRDGLLPAAVCQDLSRLRESLLLAAESIGAGCIPPAQARASLLDMERRIARIEQAASGRL